MWIEGLSKTSRKVGEYLLTFQNGMCEWCGKEIYLGKGISHIDHNHRCCNDVYSCGRCIRGLVCSSDNTGAIRSADWAYSNGLVLPSKMLAYITRGEPGTEPFHYLPEDIQFGRSHRFNVEREFNCISAG